MNRPNRHDSQTRSWVTGRSVNIAPIAGATRAAVGDFFGRAALNIDGIRDKMVCQKNRTLTLVEFCLLDVSMSKVARCVREKRIVVDRTL